MSKSAKRSNRRRRPAAGSAREAAGNITETVSASTPGAIASEPQRTISVPVPVITFVQYMDATEVYVNGELFVTREPVVAQEMQLLANKLFIGGALRTSVEHLTHLRKYGDR
jgi:hypothetical protein